MTAYSQGDPRQKIQLCDECHEPTGNCEDDSLYNCTTGRDGPRSAPVCSDCFISYDYDGATE